MRYRFAFFIVAFLFGWAVSVAYAQRVTDGQVVVYGFQEGTGLTVRDVSGTGAPLDLTITDGAGISWLPTGGLALSSPTLITSGGAAVKVIDAVKVSGEITIEAWVTPANTRQDGPARIVTLSQNTTNRNFTLGQGLWDEQSSDLYDIRLRTTTTTANGMPSLSTPTGTLIPALTHVVYTRDVFGTITFYVNGGEVSSRVDGGDLSNWDNEYALALGDEVSGDRPWLGEYHLVAIFDRALSPAEVQQNFAAGPSLSPQLPIIVTQPVAQTVSEGQPATFRVTATGADPLEYQWQQNGVDILGAQGARYTTPPVTTADDGTRFRCVVTNTAGMTTSDEVVLTVLETSARIVDDLEALYLFAAGSGDTVFDVAGVRTPLNLNIPDPTAVSWIPGGGLVLNTATQIASVDPATEISDAIAVSGEVMLEAWIKPAKLTQNGPARIVTLSGNPFMRNVTLGQGAASGSPEFYDVRLRTTGTSDNGTPSLSTAVGSLTTELTHVVYTRDVCGTTHIYLDGVQAVTGVAPGDLSDWNTSFKLALGEEFGSSTRSWLGEYRSVALYSRALSELEVAQNFAAGLVGLSPPPILGERPVALFTANPTTSNVPLSVNFDASTSFDPDGTIVSYSWQFGDGQTATGVTASHTYLDSGCLIATLQVTDDQGLVRSASVPITPGSMLTPGSLSWQSLSSAAGDLPVPGSNPEQTAAVVFDINNDGVNDFVIGTRLGSGPSVVWYERTSSGWVLHTIDRENLPIEAGGASHDIDGDGDLDLVLGADSSGTNLWWWENPNPHFASDWTRRRIKIGGGNQHHDQMFGDFDGDGTTEFVYWNNKADKLFFAEVPADPTVEPWPATQIFAANPNSPQSEGLAKSDIDGDGVEDIVGAGYWFKHVGRGAFDANPIDPAMSFTRVAVGQLIAGGRPEVVFDSGDGTGPLRLYEWDDASWIGSDLLPVPSRFGHSLNIGDIDNDGHLDILSAEMILGGVSDAKMRLFLGDGTGNFELVEFATGIANHESKLADLDADGDLDILGKPFRDGVPGINIWLNEGRNPFAFWRRQVADDSVPWRTIFVEHGDIDGDGLEDVITGGWWWKNPGHISGSWTRHTIGVPLNQMAAVYDFDNDGDLDVLGTEGRGSEPNGSFVWARNDGRGVFTILNNIENGEGDFLQGVAVERFQGNLAVVLSWHVDNTGIQQLTVPANPSNQMWVWDEITATSQNEELSTGDIDQDGDIDLLLGTQWLRNDNTSWETLVLHSTSDTPDRNRLADINQDGRLDAVVGFEAARIGGKLAWYEQPTDPEALWIEHPIAKLGPVQVHSLDVADIDGDGDYDIVAGEHTNPDRGGLRMLVFENTGSDTWPVYEIYAGDEHHDGAQLVDLDQDGDLDIISIGWLHRKLLIYENLQY